MHWAQNQQWFKAVSSSKDQLKAQYLSAEADSAHRILLDCPGAIGVIYYMGDYDDDKRYLMQIVVGNITPHQTATDSIKSAAIMQLQRHFNNK